jgi:hypothetical protein
MWSESGGRGSRLAVETRLSALKRNERYFAYGVEKGVRC